MSIFCHDFNEQTREDRETLQAYFRGFDYRGAGYTYISNYIWRNTYCLSWEIIESYLCMAGRDCMDKESAAVSCMPLTRDGNYDTERLRKAVLASRDRFEAKQVPFLMTLIPEHMKTFLDQAFPGQIEWTPDRDDYEYVYSKDKLIRLPGRALHKKKNHLNYFLRTFPYETKSISPACAEEILAFTEKHKEIKEDQDRREAESLEAEMDAIREMVSLTDRLDVYSTAIYVAGELVAFAMGERLSPDTAVEHFEKASEEYRGLYQLVCREFCLALPEEIRFVNREEDMGLENLRQAKEALKPDRMEKRFSARLIEK